MCPLCGDRLYVPHSTDRTWIPCACRADVLQQLYIKPGIRLEETTLPDACRAWPLIPWKDALIGGDYVHFRHWVWRTLEARTDEAPRYEFLSLTRLVEIHFGRDTTTYESLSAVTALPLLIVSMGVLDMPNSYAPHIMAHVFSERQHKGQPTWVYFYDPRRVGSVYSEALDRLLRPVIVWAPYMPSPALVIGGPGTGTTLSVPADSTQPASPHSGAFNPMDPV